MPQRYLHDEDYLHAHPVHVVWELTLACNLKCLHCGSRAGKVRPGELSTEEALDVVRQLAALGVRAISVIGGEAYLRRDWIEIIRAITDHGIEAGMQTGGRALTEEKVVRAKEAGLRACGVSIDGLADLHDELRGVKGSFASAMEALGHLKRHGIPSGVNTQITSRTMPQLRNILHAIAAAGATNWQIQLTVAMGNAVDHPELLLQPYELLDLMPLLDELYDEAASMGVLIQPGNNIGYFGPYEHRWRLADHEEGHWQGCMAGHAVLGIEADGTIKGCPSLPTVGFSGGNVRDLSIADMWKMSSALRFSRDRGLNDLWGRCGDCYYADVCRAGCTWTGTVLFGRPGNNPYCHYRALKLAEQGLRERIVKTADAPGRSFDEGKFDLITEPLDGGDGPRSVAVPPPWTFRDVQVAREADRVPPQLPLCRGCNQYVLEGTESCPHCGSDIAAEATQYAENLATLYAAAEKVRALLAQ